VLGGDTLIPTANAVEALRERKDAAELARHGARRRHCGRRAVRGAATAEPGITEEHFALELDTAMRRRGAEGTAFETIVAAGENSAKPPNHPGPRRIKEGDPVVVDFGAMFEGTAPT